jgi:hypothetical protein
MYKLFFLFLFITVRIFSQGVTDSIKELNKINPKENTSSEQTLAKNKLLIPIESFKIFIDPFRIPFNNIYLRSGYNYSNTYIPLEFTADTDYLISLNNKEFLQQISSNYQISKPGTFQKILGMVQVGAAAALAGYHIYKYEIKKEKK